MRYRKLDANLDFSWGHNDADFLVNDPQAVAQLILTRLKLWTGEWFLDLTEGTAWLPNVPNPGTPGVVGRQPAVVPGGAARDLIIRNRILSTQGVTEILAYQSNLDPIARIFTVAATVQTVYSTQPVPISLGLGAAGFFTLDATPLLTTR